MNVHVFVNAGQRILLDEFFRPSLKDNWNLIEHESALPEAQNYDTDSYWQIILQKVRLLVEEVFAKERGNELSIVSDIDIQFFQSCDALVRESMQGKDIVFQSELGTQLPLINAGFYCFRPDCAAVQSYWSWVLEEMERRKSQNMFFGEQHIMNETLSSSGLRWGQFPDTLATISNRNFYFWGQDIRKIRLHHATCTLPNGQKSSLERKIEQLRDVAESYQKYAE